MTDTAAPTTGATAEQIEDAAERWYSEWRANGLNLTAHLPAWPDLDERTKANVRNAELVCFQRVVPPGFVIAPAADVLTAEDRAAIGLLAESERLRRIINKATRDRKRAYEFVLTRDEVHRQLNEIDLALLARLAAGGDGR